MFARLALCAFLFSLSMGLHAVDAPEPPALVKGERILFFGDSITAGASSPKGFITVIKNTLTEKYKDLGIETINAGISGHKVPDLQKRLQHDVLDKKPTIVFIYIGINDVWHSERGQGTSKADFESGLKDLIAKITANGARVILCTATVIGEKTDGSNKLDTMLEEYCAISRKVAEDTKTPLCDLHKAFMNYLKVNNNNNLEKGVLTADRVHLNDAGNKLVAETMLVSLGVK